MKKFLIFDYINAYKEPNNLFIFFSLLCFLNNSIFSLNENLSIYFYFLIFSLISFVKFNFKFYKPIYTKNKFVILLVIILPSILFVILRYKNGISFKGDEIAHYSNSLSNLSYWFTPQNLDIGLTNFFKISNVKLIYLINIKIFNLFILIVINYFSYFYLKKYFNFVLFASTLCLIFFQKSFPYEYSQEVFFIDNITQIALYFISPFSFSESIGYTNFIFFIIYLILLRPAINNNNLSTKDIKLFLPLLIFPSLNILLFSNYQECIAVIFALLAIENYFKFNNLKNAAVLFAIAGCFREIFFLPIIIIVFFDIIKKDQKFFNNLIFYLIILAPFVFHILHINRNLYGEEKMEFLFTISNFLFMRYELSFLSFFKIFLVIVPIILSLYFFRIYKNEKYLIIMLFNLPIVLLLIYRNNLTFLDIDRFYFLWVLIFYFYILIYFSKYTFPRYFVFILILLILFNNYTFFKNYNNFYGGNESSFNLYLPIKKLLVTNSNLQELEINTDIQINKFNRDLYPNLRSVTFNDINNFNLCNCDEKILNVFILKNSNKYNYCDLNQSRCKKIYNFKNNLYQIDAYK